MQRGIGLVKILLTSESFNASPKANDLCFPFSFNNISFPNSPFGICSLSPCLNSRASLESVGCFLISSINFIMQASSYYKFYTRESFCSSQRGLCILLHLQLPTSSYFDNCQNPPTIDGDYRERS